MKLTTTSLWDIFNQIESQTDFSFTYNPNAISFKQEVKLEIEKGTVYEVLKEISKQTHMTFVQVNDNIHVKKNNDEIQIGDSAKLIDLVITGKITDSNGKQLPGASITLEGTTIERYLTWMGIILFLFLRVQFWFFLT